MALRHLMLLPPTKSHDEATWMSLFFCTARMLHQENKGVLLLLRRQK
ncbi:hypothetical protein [Acinetobacter sp. ANC 4779]|nr:hypothetical protein [Acinetobacter sp. ANC 4779]